VIIPLFIPNKPGLDNKLFLKLANSIEWLMLGTLVLTDGIAWMDVIWAAPLVKTVGLTAPQMVLLAVVLMCSSMVVVVL
jgi:hypothetical protein